MRQLLLSVFLGLATLALTAGGFVIPANAAVLWIGAAVCLVVLVLSLVRHQIGSGLIRLGTGLGGKPRRPALFVGSTGTAPVGPSAEAKAARYVLDQIAKAMAAASYDREHGSHPHEDEANKAARDAGAGAQAIIDEDARNLVREWKQQWDAIPKGWRQHNGYPIPHWHWLNTAADNASQRLGEVIRKG